MTTPVETKIDTRQDAKSAPTATLPIEIGKTSKTSTKTNESQLLSVSPNQTEQRQTKTKDKKDKKSRVGIAPGHALAPERSAGAFATKRARKRYFTIIAILAVIALITIYGNLAWNNPLPFGSDGFWLIAKIRATTMVVIALVAVCQAAATVAFQTTTGNRIITPSLMGFESLYTLIQTSAVFFFGTAGLTYLQETSQFALQVGLMLVFSAILYGWLLGGRFSNMQIMLLIGIILASAMGTISSFMQRLLEPTTYDILQARLIGSISNADSDYFPIAIPLVVLGVAFLYWQAPKLDALSLGRQVATNLGVSHKKYSMLMLFLVSILMAVSTSLVGPLTFFGFLSAMIAYQLADTYSHRHLLPMAALVGFVVLSGCYFILKNIFYAEGSVSVIIEMLGGTFFLLYLLRKGKL